MSDLISVIIPVYKVEDYLVRCVNSVIKQSYKNLEIILVNDGSPDRSGEICDEYTRIDDRIKVIHKENGGLSDARNAGIEIAKGDYLAFIDSDDWVNEDYFMKLYELIITTQSDIASCSYLKTDGNEIPTYQEKKVYNFTSLEALEQLTNQFYSQLVVAWGKIYRANIFEDIRYPYGKIHEDEFVIHHLISKTDNIVLTNEQLYYYYQRADSIIGSGFNIVGRLNIAQALEDRAQLMENLGLIRSRDSVYQTLFIIYRQIIEYDDIGKEKYYCKSEFLKKYNELRLKLRKGNISLKYKFFYELYYIMPHLMRKIFTLYKKHKKIS